MSLGLKIKSLNLGGKPKAPAPKASPERPKGPTPATQEPCIQISNSFCRVWNFPVRALELIAETLTYENTEAILEKKNCQIQLSYAYKFKNRQKVGFFKARLAELEKQLKICWFKGESFPTGHLSIVREALDGIRQTYAMEDLREVPGPSLGLRWRRDPLPLRYYQEEMVARGMDAHRGVFEASVGSGKTRIMQELIYKLDVPHLVVLPSKDLQVQTYDVLESVFGQGKLELLTTAKVRKGGKLKPIRLATMQTLAALKKSGELGPVLEGMCAISLDECHHGAANSFTSLLKDFEHIYYRFGYSGTFLRNDSKTLDMHGFVSDVLYSYPASRATEEGYLTPLEVHVHSVQGVYKNNYQKEYKSNYCNNSPLLPKIREIIESRVGVGDQVLILVKQKDDAGAVIHQYLSTCGIKSTYISGDDKKDRVKEVLQDFNDKRIKILIGSTIIGEGIDVRSTDHLIMAQGGKSEIAITQAVGRAVRLFEGKKKAYVHDFRLLGTKYMEIHHGKRLGIYKKNFAAAIVGIDSDFVVDDGDVLDSDGSNDGEDYDLD